MLFSAKIFFKINIAFNYRKWLDSRIIPLKEQKAQAPRLAPTSKCSEEKKMAIFPFYSLQVI
jgi:hypothetical protein